MNEPLVLNDQMAIPAAELRFSFSRSGGPGGQNVNKVNTKATLRWAVWRSTAIPSAVKQRFASRFASRITYQGEVVLQCETHRHQAQNATECRARLRAMLLSVARPPRARKKTKPSRAANQRRLEKKREQSQKKQQRRPPPFE